MAHFNVAMDFEIETKAEVGPVYTTLSAICTGALLSDGSDIPMSRFGVGGGIAKV